MRHPLPRVVLLLSVLLSGLLLAAHGPTPARASTTWATKVDEPLLQATADGTAAEFLIVLNAQADLSGATALRDKTARGEYVYQTLTAMASRTQAPVRAILDARGATYRPYWIHNMIWVSGDLELVRLMASRSDIFHVYANEWQRAELPRPDAPPVGSRALKSIEWNIELTNAPDAWAEGYFGQSAVIGGQDTGYEWQHPAIMAQYRGWDGQNASHDYNWHDAIHAEDPNPFVAYIPTALKHYNRHDAIHTEDPNNPALNPCGFSTAAPCDDQGHGTHTMGTMVGETSNSRIGMAPGTKWIGCRNMESGWGSPVTYAECYEWFIAPYPHGGDSFTDGDPSRAPHVINNSWSCPMNEGCTSVDILREVVEAVTAAGIVTVHSAGNSGSNCGSINTPSAIYDASFTVGATDVTDDIASFSSRGPVTADGSGRRKPDIVAPGVGVYSSYRGGLYASLSGTSMAAPHVAGLVALLISADPDLAGQVEAIEHIIAQSGHRLLTEQGCGDDTPTSVPNNVYGWGRIDALAALSLVDARNYEFQPLLPGLFNPADPVPTR